MINTTPEKNKAEHETTTVEKESQTIRKKLRFKIENDGETIVLKRSHVFATLLPLVFAVGLGVGYLLWGRTAPTTPPVETPVAQAPADQQQAVKRYSVPEDDDPSIGPRNAPITLIEFSDFECPYCRSWFNEVYLRLRQDYADQVRVVFRDYPLASIHPNAIPAAIAANCANEQGKYWEYHNKLFSGDQLGESIYKQYAQDLGLDLAKFEACRTSPEAQEEIQADYEYASGLGVRSTPTFFLNGLPIVGAQPYEMFKQVIDQELAGEIP